MHTKKISVGPTSRARTVCEVIQVQVWSPRSRIPWICIESGKISLNPNKTKSIEAWEKPTSNKELQSLLALVNYYRRFIRNCFKIAKPLTELTKSVPSNWSRSAQDAFEELKKTIITARDLAQFDPQRKIYVTTDACKFSTGAVIEQGYNDGRHPLAFIS